MMKGLYCKSLSSRLDSHLKDLTPLIQQICVLGLESPEQQRNPLFEHFLVTLIKGTDLVKKCENVSPLNLRRNHKYAKEILKLEDEINDFIQHQIPVNVLLDVRKLIADLRNVQQVHVLQSSDIGKINDSIFKKVSKLTNDPFENTMLLQKMGRDELFDTDQSCTPEMLTSSYNGPEKSNFVVGLEESIVNLKELLFRSDVSVVGVQCMGGGGKTTLALALCNDPEIKGFFGNNVVFITVSQSPNLKGILETMWDKIIGKKKPEFQNAEDAHRQLQQQLQRQSKPTLVMLDDIWSRANLAKLLFEREGYKTLVTTRDCSTIPKNQFTQLYQLPLLGEADALSLFCFWAFGQTSIPNTEDENLVKQVQAECKGLPLALKVIGSSLHGEPRPVWESAKNKLSRAESISDYHKDGLYRCLETSIDVLDEEARECFLDLGSFPEDKKICTDALLDIWVYVRGLDWQDAFVILLELASRNLLTLTSNPGSQAISYGSVSELYFSQHDVMRDFALYLASQESLVHRRRLFMPKEEYGLPMKWGVLKAQAFDAKIVSIHTGAMDEKQWCQMDFPEAEALILHFTASEYFLPSFLRTMAKLKVLILFNYGSKRATLGGLSALSSLTQLKSVRLERLIVPLLQEHSKVFQSLEKLSLSLCEGLGNLETFNIKPGSKLSTILDFNVDHCCDLEELPVSICEMTSIQRWSITNCHLVHKLPDDFGRLSSLKMLRLSACPGLKELPASICNLWQLEFLDISLCGCLEELPVEIGQLSNLRELDMRECSRLRKVPKSVNGLMSLKHVICDEKIEQQWMRIKNFAIPQLRVEVVEEHFNLDWLDY
eukprot:Gb_07066 [translate_table: standard]